MALTILWIFTHKTPTNQKNKTWVQIYSKIKSTITLSFALIVEGNDVVEFIEGEWLVWRGLSVDESWVHHFQNVVIVHVFLDWLETVFEFFEINVSIFVLIEKGEDSSDTILGFDLTDGSSGDFDKFFELDGSVGFFEFVDDANDEWVSFVNT